jgi:hypothetical protein
MTGKGDFASLEATNATGTSTPDVQKDEKANAGSVKKGGKGDGKSSIAGATFNLANAVRPRINATDGAGSRSGADTVGW